MSKFLNGLTLALLAGVVGACGDNGNNNTPDAAARIDSAPMIDASGSIDANTTIDAGTPIDAVMNPDALVCDVGFDDCNDDVSDGCETQINGGDEANCGACDMACGGGEICDVDTCVVADAAPTLINTSTDPVAHTDGTFTVTFSEPVAWNGNGTFACLGAEPTSFSVSTVDDLTFTVAMVGTLAFGGTCTLTIPAAAVTDLDPNDAMFDAMEADAEAMMTSVQLSEDFQATTVIGGGPQRMLPAGWTVENVDNRTPDSGVSYVNAAWIVREDFANDVNDFSLFSTSWYSPTGVANDWVFTPEVAIGEGCTLSWNAVAYDPMFQDGYEVRLCTTATAAGCVGTAPLVTIAAEQSTWLTRTFDLSSLAGEVGYISYRNNSDDKFLLLVDDIAISCP